METRFDQISRALAESTTRREALGRLGALLAAAIAASIGLDRPGWSAAGGCKTVCAGRRGHAHRNCMKRCAKCVRQGLQTCSPGPSDPVDCCGSEWSCCDGQCVDPTRDSDHCDTCGHVCPPERPDCCGSHGVGYCTNVAGDTGNCGECGRECRDQEKCEAGTCIGVCPAGTAFCEGSHGQDCCGDDENCCDGGCCPEPLHCCGPVGGRFCTDVRTDRQNCGFCNVVCTGGQVCQNGRCGCPPGTDLRRDAILGGEMCEPVCNPACGPAQVCCQDGHCYASALDSLGLPIPTDCCRTSDGQHYWTCPRGTSCCSGTLRNGIEWWGLCNPPEGIRCHRGAYVRIGGPCNPGDE